jgi:hypothetical protein
VIRGRNFEESSHDITEALTRHSPGETEENIEKLGSENPVSWLKFES